MFRQKKIQKQKREWIAQYGHRPVLCLQCDESQLITHMVFTARCVEYKGRMSKPVNGHHCPKCGEIYFHTVRDVGRFTALVDAFHLEGPK